MSSIPSAPERSSPEAKPPEGTLSEATEPGAPPAEGPSPERGRARASALIERLLWVVAIVLVSLALWPKKSGPAVGGVAPRLTLPLVGAEGEVTLATPGDRPLLVEAFASWCTACKSSNQTLSALTDPSLRGKLDVLAVSVDDTAEAADGARRSWPIHARVAHDRTGAFSREYKVRVLPTYILISPGGEILDVVSGTVGAATVRSWLQRVD